MPIPVHLHARPSAPGSLGYRPELDGLRGIAVLAVLAVHSRLWFPGFGFHGGVLGVDLFFVLSGFLITTLMGAEVARTGRLSRGRFYARRAIRLLPGLGAALGLGALATWIIGRNPHGMPYPRAALASLLFAGNWFHHRLGTLAHTWSLGLEEQFYIVWPAIFVFLSRRRVPVSRTIRGLVVAAIAVAVTRSLVHHTFHPLPRWTVAALVPLLRADGVLIGSALALALASGAGGDVARLLRTRTVALIGTVAAIGVVVRASLGSAHDVIALANLAFAAVIGHVVTARDGGLARALRSRALVGVGLLSYGLYLFHYPVFFLTRHLVEARPLAAVAGWTLSFGAAAVSYIAVERPALRLRSVFRPGRGAELGVEATPAPAAGRLHAYATAAAD